LPDGDRGGPLEGLVVLELAETLAGELAGGLLADLGATVIKLEPPEGSPLRRRGPALAGEDSLYFQSENRGKYSVCAAPGDLVREAWLTGLLPLADAVIEDLGPGRLEASGLVPDILERANPRLCILRISPFGQSGPLAGTAGDDRIAQAFANVQFTTGYPDRPPVPVTLPLADCWTGINGASGLLMAIFHARAGDRGQVVDLALYETPLRLQEGVIVRHFRTGEMAARMGTESPTIVPANVYATRDGGWVALSGAGDQPFARLCEAIGAPEAPRDPRFVSGDARRANRTDADRLVAAWIGRHDLADVEARFMAAGVAGTAVRSVDDIVTNEHVQARGSLMSLRSPSGVDFLAPAPVPRFSRTEARRPTRAPGLGEHTDAVRAWVEGATGQSPLPARPPSGAAGGGALGGVRVLDLSQWLAGPAAAAMLGDFGADVVMVELPGQAPAPRALDFTVTNRNKRSITLDVRSPEGRAVFLDLVRVSDVVVENFRPGTLERWDLAPEALLAANPRLIVLRCSGFGQSGPYRSRSAFNPVGLAFGGMTYLNGWPDRAPVRDGVQAGDYATALVNVLGTMAALLRRDRDGAGQVVDTAMFEAVLRMTGDLLAARSALGIRRERAGGEWSLYPCSLTVETSDGRHVAVSSDSWERVFSAVEALGVSRPVDAAQARAGLMRVAAMLSAAEAVATFRRAGLLAIAVGSVADLAEDPHVRARGNLVRVAGAGVGEVVMPGVVPALSRTPGRVAGWSPFPGSDNDAVRGAAAARHASGTPAGRARP
jgi:formyl-CoA transferase